ncbi:acyl carrier protein phosphodiesterase [Psychroflexus aestuariivivens]|uniref:acyl carrier protein phosphodiesterase n=1 Tax=Psychroflexus aestuariivivens TaxID=1795040 RepID=UPI000FD90314|nr:acyl carrier protein phosphodiesterase [Psychroflexus aestuariivivens]
MNYLAHIYLSGNNDFLKIGNFIADEIKGKSYKSFPKPIQKGILLHRQIDNFTDHHSIVSKSASRFFADFGHYNTVIVDVIYDHILAKNWSEYSIVPLDEFVDDFYNLVLIYKQILPPRVSKMLPYMIDQNWLLNYASLKGITQILKQMNNRTIHETRLHESIQIYLEYQKEFDLEFKNFFEEIQSFCKNEIQKVKPEL